MRTVPVLAVFLQLANVLGSDLLLAANVPSDNKMDIVDVVTDSDVVISGLNSDVQCKLQPNGYNCKDLGVVDRFYYDLKLENCRTAPVGKCQHTEFNAFPTLLECRKYCIDEGGHHIKMNLTPDVFCRLQPDFGTCDDYHPKFYFDVTHRECRGFSFSGCMGNANRFNTLQHCTATCVDAVVY